MSKYTPLPPPQEAESVPLYLQNELQKISQATDIIEERLDTDTTDSLASNWQTVDLNTVQTKDYNLTYDHYSQASSNKPNASPDNANAVLTANTHSSNYRHQLAFNSDEKFYHRAQQNGTWTDWGRVVVNGADTHLELRGGSTTVYLRDTNANSSMLHCNSNRFYILRGGNDTNTWSTVGGHWPVYWDLTNNNAYFGGSITEYSDAKLKENIRPIGNSMEMFDKLEAKRYNMIDGGKPDIGFIAQDVQAAGLDEVVIESEDKDLETGEVLGTTLTLNYTHMTPVLWDVVKELKAQVESLKAEVEELKGT
jgi:hypothetical protein